MHFLLSMYLSLNIPKCHLSNQEQLEKVTPEIKKEMDWSAEIVKRIEQILKERGITQRELASRIGCNETQIVRWTRGFPNYTLSTLAKLSVALGEDLICMSPVLF